MLVFFYIKKFSCAFCQKPRCVRRNFCIKEPGKKWYYSFYIVRQGRFFLYLCPFAGALSRSVEKKERFAFLVSAKIEISACFFVDAAKNMTFLLNFCTSAVKRQKKLCCFCAIRTLNPDVNCGKKILFAFCKNVQIFYRAVKIYLLFKSKINKNSCILRKNIV